MTTWEKNHTATQITSILESMIPSLISAVGSVIHRSEERGEPSTLANTTIKHPDKKLFPNYFKGKLLASTISTTRWKHHSRSSEEVPELHKGKGKSNYRDREDLSIKKDTEHKQKQKDKDRGDTGDDPTRS